MKLDTCSSQRAAQTNRTSQRQGSFTAFFFLSGGSVNLSTKLKNWTFNLIREFWLYRDHSLTKQGTRESAVGGQFGSMCRRSPDVIYANGFVKAASSRVTREPILNRAMRKLQELLIAELQYA